MIKVKSIWKYIKVGDTVRYLGDLIEVKRKSNIDKLYCHNAIKLDISRTIHTAECPFANERNDLKDST